MTTVVHVSQPHDVCVMRPGKWGNPYRVGIHGTRLECVMRYKEWLPQQMDLMADLGELQGKRIACGCHGYPCHAYVLAEEADKISPRLALQDRLDSYKSTGFPEALFLSEDGRIVGTWIMGNDYRVKSEFYGGYPPTYLKRIAALFPDRRKVLHLFSGRVDLTVMPGDTVDINADNNPTWVDDAQRLTQVPVEDYDLVLADPPYSKEDCDHYQCSMIKRNLVMKTLGERLKPGAFVVWLDQVLPMYRKDQFDMVGAIGMYKSTNHRIRGVTIFRKNNLTDLQGTVNVPSHLAREGHNPNTTKMTTKHLALVAGILATAFGQIKNVLSGEDDDDAAETKPAKRGRPAKTPPPEEEDEEDNEEDGVTKGGEASDDEEELKDAARAKAAKLFEKDADKYKPLVKKLINKHGDGATRITDMEPAAFKAFWKEFQAVK